MKLQRIKSGPFHRFGDQYGHLIDADHFLGRTAFDDLWMSKAKPRFKKRDVGYDLEIPLPGFKKDEISLTIENNHLVLNAKKEEGSEEENVSDDQTSDKFNERIMELSQNIDQDKISANLEDGILKIRLPQKPVKERDIKTVAVD